MAQNNEKVEEVYVDGIGNITFMGGVIRADLVGYKGNKASEKEQPELLTKKRIIFSPQGFLQATSAINNLMKKMIDAGVITQKEQQEIEKQKQ